MMPDDLDELLFEWGRYFGREARQTAEVHPLERAREFAPGKRARSVVVRDGGDRRRTMAAAAVAGSKLSMRVVPMDYVESVPCIETRTMRTPGRDWPVPPHLERVNRAALDLIARMPLQGLCLQARYCRRDFDAARAEWVASTLRNEHGIDMPVSVKRFRDELIKAKFWVHARLCD